MAAQRVGFSGFAVSLLLIAVILVAYAEFNWPPWTLFPLLAFSAAAAIPSPLRCPACLLAKSVAPLCIGILAVLFYREIHQDQNLISSPIFELTGKDLKDLLKNAEFNESYKEQFYTAMATLFAIVVGLALVEGIEAVQKIRASITNETYHIRSIVHFLSYFEDDELVANGTPKVVEAKYRLIERLLRYADLIHAGEDTQRTGSPSQAGKILDECQRIMIELHPFDDDDRTAQSHIVALLQQVGLARQRRVTFRGEHPPLYMMAALWLMCGALVIPFLAETLCINPANPPVLAGAQFVSQATAAVALESRGPRCPAGLAPSEQRYSQYFMIFIIVSFFSFIMLMLHDVADTRDGFWSLEYDEFGQLADDLRQTGGGPAESARSPTNGAAQNASAPLAGQPAGSGVILRS